MELIQAQTLNELINARIPYLTQKRTIASGQTLTRGSGLAEVSGEMVFLTPGAVNGSEVPDAILVNDIDTTAGAEVVEVIVFGAVNKQFVLTSNSTMDDTVVKGFRAKNIYLTESVGQ